VTEAEVLPACFFEAQLHQPLYQLNGNIRLPLFPGGREECRTVGRKPLVARVPSQWCSV